MKRKLDLIGLDSSWNQWLFQQIGLKIFQWIHEIVINDRFSFQAYQLIPTKLNLTNNKLSQHFNEAFAWNIEHYPFIRNRFNQLLKVDFINEKMIYFSLGE